MIWRGRQDKQRGDGFSVIELVIVISIIGIIAGLVAVYLPQSLVRARDQERIADVTSIARELERIYRENGSQSSGGPTYPSTKGGGGIISVLDAFTNSGLGPATTAPGETNGTMSLAPVTPNSASNTAMPSPTTQQYLYQPFRADGKLCNYDSPSEIKPCVRFKLWYRLEETNSIESIESLHQQ